MTLYKLIKPGETIPENAVIFSHNQTPMQSPRVGEEFDPKSFIYAHFIPVEVPDENPAPAPQAEEIPLGPEDVPPQSCFRHTRDQPSVLFWNLFKVHEGGIELGSGAEWTFKKLLDSGMEISRDFGKTWQPCRKPAQAVEPVWHNPENVGGYCYNGGQWKPVESATPGNLP